MESFILKKRELSTCNHHEVSNLILNHTVLCINNIIHRICEIEIYMRDINHNNEYVHYDADQKEYDKYYFHKFNNGTFKNRTFKGLDLI